MVFQRKGKQLRSLVGVLGVIVVGQRYQCFWEGDVLFCVDGQVFFVFGILLEYQELGFQCEVWFGNGVQLSFSCEIMVKFFNVVSFGFFFGDMGILQRLQYYRVVRWRRWCGQSLGVGQAFFRVQQGCFDNDEGSATDCGRV